MKVAIIVSEFHPRVAGGLLKGTLQGLLESGVKMRDVHTVRVPGAFEIPFTAQRLIDGKKYDGLIALGCVLRGETDHYAAVCAGVTYGIQKVSIENRVPVMFGVLMCATGQQARARSGSGKNNKGYECAKGLLQILGNL